MPWDFLLILLLLGGVVPILGRRRMRKLMAAPFTTRAERLSLYASTIIFQWLASGLIYWRTRAHGISLIELGVTLINPILAISVAGGFSLLLFSNQLFALRQVRSHPEVATGLLPKIAMKIFPQDNLERVWFSLLVATVAICEEFIFRGFVQIVFQRWMNNWVIAGVIFSALLFSWAHLYQGRRGLISTFVAGLLFSTARVWTGSLLPSVTAHFVADLTVGFRAPSEFKAVLTQENSASSGSTLATE